MNQIAMKFLLSGEKFMSEAHLRQLGFSLCRLFTKNIERMQK